MKAKDTALLGTLRGLMGAFIKELTDMKQKPDGELTDDQAQAVIKREVKKRKDSILQFEKGGRSDLAETERAELAILETYLPEMMSKDDIRVLVEKTMKKIGVTDATGKGKLIGAVIKSADGNADGALVKAVVDELL